MSNAPQTLTNIIKNISANQMQKTGYTTIGNAEVMALVNPFTKEYKIKIDGIPVTAYGIYDVVYKVGDWVVVIESDVDNTKDRYIIAESNIVGNQFFDNNPQDKYSQIGTPIDLGQTNGWKSNIGIPMIAHGYCKVSTIFVPSYTDERFESKITIEFDKGDPIVYSSNLMEGSLELDKEIAQLSSYFQAPEGATKIVSIIQEDEDPGAKDDENKKTSTWKGVTLTFYINAEEWGATTLQILAPNGYEVIADEIAELILEAKLHNDSIHINPNAVTYIWFRENPLVVEGHNNYDARAGAGWEEIILPVQAE